MAKTFCPKEGVYLEDMCYKVRVLGRGISARHLTKRSAKTLVLMWREIGFKAKIQKE